MPNRSLNRHSVKGERQWDVFGLGRWWPWSQFSSCLESGLAQEATIGGTVTDSTSGVLPGVVLRAVHEATGTQFETVTDDRGVFRIPVRIGVYRMTAELSGFRPVERSGLEVLVGQQITINLEMSPSTVSETVT